jgi:hypothetical protein
MAAAAPAPTAARDHRLGRRLAHTTASQTSPTASAWVESLCPVDDWNSWLRLVRAVARWSAMVSARPMAVAAQAAFSAHTERVAGLETTPMPTTAAPSSSTTPT